MTKKRNVPELRLKGFSNEWASLDFDVFFDSSIPKNTLSRANLTTEQTEVKNIHYGDILINFASVVDVANDVYTYIKDAKLDQYKGQCLKDGDVIFADAAEDETVGKSIEIRSVLNQHIVSGLHTIPCRPRKPIMPFFLGHYLNSNAYHRQLLPLMQGTKVLSISKTSLMKTILKIPDAQDEQKKIGENFQSIDCLISFQSKRYEKLLNVKKAMLEKMFPKDGADFPEIRFKGFTKNWDKCELGKLTDVIDGDRGSNYPSKNDLQDRGHTLFLSASNVTKNGFRFNINEYITEKKSNNLGNGKLELNDIILTSRGSLGHIAWYNETIQNQLPFVRINSGMLILRSSKLIEPSFLVQFLNMPLGKKQIDFISFGSAQPQLTKKDVLNYMVAFPNDIAEQIKLGKYFQSLDQLITLTQLELEKLKNIKKAMLEKMFV